VEMSGEADASFCVRIRRRMPCTNLQLWGAYTILLLGVLMFAFLIYSQERILALVLISFALGVNVFICLRLLFLALRRTTPYRQLPWEAHDDTSEPLDPALPLENAELETLSPGAAMRRDEMIVMQLQLLELKQARRYNRRERDRQRGLLRLGFTPFSDPNNNSTHLQLSMLDREFGPNDYDMLLKLDDELARSRAARIPQGQPLPGGLSTSQINLFPSFIMSTTQPTDTGLKEYKELETVKKSQPIENCAICLEPKVGGEVLRTVPCLHTFHVQCIDPWLQLKRTCPVCKMDFAQA